MLRVAACGGTVADIARAACLGEGTVRNYLSAAMSKTGARTHTDAVSIAQNNGWLLGATLARTAQNGCETRSQGDRREAVGKL